MTENAADNGCRDGCHARERAEHDAHHGGGRGGGRRAAISAAVCIALLCHGARGVVHRVHAVTVVAATRCERIGVSFGGTQVIKIAQRVRVQLCV